MNHHSEDIDEIFNFLFENKLIIDEPPVCDCGSRFKIKKTTDSGDKYTCRSTKCLKTKSERTKTF